MLDLDALDFSKGRGVVTVVAQDAVTGAVLMVAHADREALERTMATGEMHYRSRTRGLWHKGATSGNTQCVVSLTRDCDGDTVLARVVSSGPACHTGAASCFAQPVSHVDAPPSASPDALRPAGGALSALDSTIAARATSVQPDGAGATAPDPERPSYTVRLLTDRNLRLKKLGEEAAELVVACSDGDATRATEEAADLLYHMLVALHAVGGSLAGVQRVLAERAEQ